MTVTKPEPQRVYLTASDPSGELKSRTITIYGATPDVIIEAVERAISSGAFQREVGNKSTSANVSDPHKAA